MKIIKTTYTPPGLSNRPNKDEIITFVNPFFSLLYLLSLQIIIFGVTEISGQ